ncbi:MAG TPA: hypothetical protein VMU47_09140 [Caldimonas sp.]|nr:hypothetical protein [Caldimonas sp.]
MKTYLLACTSAALASAAMVLWSQPDSTAAVALGSELDLGVVRVVRGGHAPGRPAMARRGAHPWLLRAMSEDAAGGTLTTAPNEPPAQPPSL